MTAQHSLDLGKQRRNEQITKHRRREILDEIDARLRALARGRSSGVVDADDAHDILEQMCEEPPWRGDVPDDTRFFGGLWGDGWQKVGYKASRRPVNHARPIAQFRLEE